MIIGFTGPKRSGKDYCASILLEDLVGWKYYTGKNVLAYSFADPLRKFVCDVFNMDERHTQGFLKEVVVRSIMPTHAHIQAACQHYFGTLEPANYISRWITPRQDRNGMIVASYRELMVSIGTSVIRDLVSQTFWLDLAKAKYVDSNKVLVVSDIRFENEAEFVRQNGVLIHIDNPGVQYTNENVTEKPIKKLDSDFTLVNNVSDRSGRKTISTKLYNILGSRL